MNDTFSIQTLAEKLSKLNNSQQSIERLSHWCIFHRKKARQIVETWTKLFNSSSQEQKVSFLYLANDILQNSRRKGSEFVNEFWKVLPEALKSVSGDDHGKSVVLRLVNIWDERKVFGSRTRGLKDDILSKAPPTPPSENNGISSNIIKVVRKDANLLRIKLAVGEMPERIVTAYQSVLDEHFSEDAALNNCKAAVHHVGMMEKDVDDACTLGTSHGSPLMIEVEGQETILKQCIEQLQSVEATRAALIALLKEALQEQESKMELIHTQLQVAQAETERTISMKQRIVSAMITTGCDPSPNPSITNLPAESASIIEPNLPPQTPSALPSQPLELITSFKNSISVPPAQLPQPLSPFPNSFSSPPQPSQTVTSFVNFLSTSQPQPQPPVTSFSYTSSALPPQPSQPPTSFVTSLSTEDQHKKAVAAVAAKLAASASSAQMLSSVLSSLAAEEAASMNGGAFTSSPPIFPVEKRPKLEKPSSVSDTSNAFLGHMQQLASLPLALPQVSATSLQPPSQTNRPPPPFPPTPPLPPLPPPPMQQYVQTGGAMVGIMPYGFGGNTFPPLPPPHLSMGLARPGTPQPPPPPLPPVPPPQQQQQQQQQQKQQQSSTTTGFFHPPGNGFYAQLQSSASPSQGSSA